MRQLRGYSDRPGGTVAAKAVQRQLRYPGIHPADALHDCLQNCQALLPAQLRLKLAAHACGPHRPTCSMYVLSGALSALKLAALALPSTSCGSLGSGEEMAPGCRGQGGGRGSAHSSVGAGLLVGR